MEAAATPKRRVLAACVLAALAIAAWLRGPLHGVLPALCLSGIAWALLALFGRRNSLRHQYIAGLAVLTLVYLSMMPPTAARLLAEIGAPPLPVSSRVAAGYQMDPYFGMRLEGTPAQLLTIAEAIGPEQRPPKAAPGWQTYFRDGRIWWQPPGPLPDGSFADPAKVRYWQRVQVPGGRTYSGLLDVANGVLYVLITTM